MNTKLIATAAGFFGFGALVSWAVTADIHENRLENERGEYDKLLKDKTARIFALKTTIQDQQRRSPVANVEQLIESVGDTPVELIQTAPEAKVLADKQEELLEEERILAETPAETQSNLQNIIDRYSGHEGDNEEFVQRVGKTFSEDFVPPFVISQELYAFDPDEGDSYSKITLTYLRPNRILLDENEELIEDVDATVGWKNLKRFGDESGDPDVVFVRNRKMTTDFEVVLDEETEPPLHVKYGMSREEFNAGRAAGIIRMRPEDLEKDD